MSMSIDVHLHAHMKIFRSSVFPALAVSRPHHEALLELPGRKLYPLAFQVADGGLSWHVPGDGLLHPRDLCIRGSAYVLWDPPGK